MTNTDKLLRLLGDRWRDTNKTIVSPVAILSCKRSSGNTTRLVDSYIQALFDNNGNNVVVCLDHHQYGNHDESNKRLLNILIKRLKIEHNIVPKNLRVDKSEKWIPFIEYDMKTFSIWWNTELFLNQITKRSLT